MSLCLILPSPAADRDKLMDIKNIDIKAISETVGRYKNAIINIAVIIVALFISYKVYEGQQNNIDAINNKKGVELQKNTIIAEISRSYSGLCRCMSCW